MALAGLWLAAGGSRCAEQAEYDAAFVRMDVPEQVVAGQVFPVTIVLRNTGTKPWPSEQFQLRSVEPQDNLSWGAGFIILRQGSTVAPGGEAVYRSYLKAPSTPGEVGFRWQVVRDGKSWFGEMTPARTLQAAPRQAEPAVAPPATDPRRRHVLAFDDFEYAGSFKPPRVVGGARGAFSECGTALRCRPWRRWKRASTHACRWRR